MARSAARTAPPAEATGVATPGRNGPSGAWRWTTAPRDDAVPRLRRAVRDVLACHAGSVPGALTDDLLLIVTELVTNGVRHAGAVTAELTVELVLGPDRVRLAVVDDHPRRPRALRGEPDPRQIGGRGLLLVRAVTREAGGSCGVTPTTRGGKSVWVALPTPAPTTP